MLRAEVDGCRSRIRKAAGRLKVRVVGATPSRTAVRLTPRQTEVLQWIVRGLKTRQIAARLGLSIKTVETHRIQLMDRIGIRNIPRLVRYALQAGVVPVSWIFE